MKRQTECGVCDWSVIGTACQDPEILVASHFLLFYNIFGFFVGQLLISWMKKLTRDGFSERALRQLKLRHGYPRTRKRSKDEFIVWV